MKWFKHDADANRDAKLVKLRMKYGIEGYGLYWYCLEIIADSVNENNYTFELEHDSEVIGFNIGMHPEKVQEIMTYMVQLKLFELYENTITCMKLASRLNQSMTSNPQMRNIIAKLRKNHDPVMTKSIENHDPVMTQSCPDKIRLDKNRKESRAKKTKSRRFTPPSLEEIKNYCLSRENNIDPETFRDFYQAKDWMIGKNKMKDWKAAVHTWERRNPQPDNRNIFSGGI